MSQLLTSVIPLSVGAAVSPVLLAASVVILALPISPRLRAWITIAGMATALLLVTVALVLAAQALSGAKPNPQFLAWIDAAAGVVLVGLGVRNWIHPRTPAQRGERTAGLGKSGGGTGAGLLGFFGIGFVLIASDLTSIVLYIPAIKDIIGAQIPALQKAAVALIPFLAVLAPALIPVGLATVAPQAADRVLRLIGDWTGKHSRVIGIVICLGFGVYLLAKAALVLVKF